MSYLNAVQVLIAVQNDAVSTPADLAASRKAHADSVSQAVRNAAKAAQADGESPESAAQFYTVAANAAGVKVGTVKAYGQAMKGFVLLLNDGESIDSGAGSKGDKPKTAKMAQAYWADRNMSDEAREIAGLVALITLRLSGVSLSELQAVAEMLPEHADEIEVKAEKPESAAARKQRENAELFAAMVAEREAVSVPVAIAA